MQKFKIKVQQLFHTDTMFGRLLFIAIIYGLFWFVFIFFPIHKAPIFLKFFKLSFDFGWIIAYIIFIIPILFIILYKFIKYILAIFKYKFIFLLVGLILPYIYIAQYLYFNLRIGIGL